MTTDQRDESWRIEIEIEGARLEADGVGTPPFDVSRVLQQFLDSIGKPSVFEELTERLRAVNARIEGVIHGITSSAGID